MLPMNHLPLGLLYNQQVLSPSPVFCLYHTGIPLASHVVTRWYWPSHHLLCGDRHSRTYGTLLSSNAGVTGLSVISSLRLGVCFLRACVRVWLCRPEDAVACPMVAATIPKYPTWLLIGGVPFICPQVDDSRWLILGLVGTVA